MATRSGTPALTRSLTAVRRKSCRSIPGAPAFRRAVAHAFPKSRRRSPRRCLPLRYGKRYGMITELPSPLQLLPQLVEETPVGETSLDDEAGGPLGFQRAHVHRLDKCPDRAFGRNRVLPYEIAIPRDHATEILRPGSIHDTVEQNVTDVLRAKLQRIGGEAQIRINLPFGEKTLRLRRRWGHEVDVAAWVQAHIRHDRREEDVLARSERGDRERLPFPVGNSAHASSAEQLEAAHVKAGEEHHGISGIDADDQRRGVLAVDVNLAGGQKLLGSTALPVSDVLDVTEPFAPQ